MRIYLKEKTIMKTENNKGEEKYYLDFSLLSLGWKTWLANLVLGLIIYGAIIVVYIVLMILVLLIIGLGGLI